MSIFTAAMIALVYWISQAKVWYGFFYYAYAIIDSTYYGTHL